MMHAFDGSGQRGIALVLVLWVLILLGVLAGSQILSARTGLQFARIEYDAAQARALAEAGVEAGIYALLTGASDHDFELVLGSGQISVAVEDEAGKLDVNNGRPDQLQRLLVNFIDEVDAEELVAAIKDFKDTDQSVSDGGAELPDYQEAGLDYGPKNRTLDSVAELQQIPGMTPHLYRLIAPYLTVHSRRREVNLAVAAPELLVLLEAGASREAGVSQPALAPAPLGLESANRQFGAGMAPAGDRFDATTQGDDDGQNADPARRSGAGVFTIRAIGRAADVRAVVAAVVQIVAGSSRRYRVLRWDNVAWGDVGGPQTATEKPL
jgi:hypothetical protein